MKRRIFSIFFALVLALSLSLVTAVPAGAQGVVEEFQSSALGEGWVKWAPEEANTGDYSVLLGLVDPANEARVAVPVSMAFADLPSLSYWYCIKTAALDTVPDAALKDSTEPDFTDFISVDGYAAPYAVIELDLDDNDTPDAWVVEARYADDSIGAWEQRSMDTTNYFHAAGGGVPAELALPNIATLADIKAHAFFADADVLKVKVMMGDWHAYITNSPEAYVDDIGVNAVPYPLEPKAVVNIDAKYPAQGLANNDTSYDTIQDGVDDALSDQTLRVAAGTYEEDIDVDVVGITIQGDSLDAIVDGGFLITVADITIDGFTIKDGRAGSTPEIAAIVVEGESDGHTLTNNTLIGLNQHDTYGINLSKLSDSVLIDGNVSYNWEFGIYLRSQCSSVTVNDNEVYDNLKIGISVAYSANSLVTDNDVHNNNTLAISEGNGGIVLYQCTNVTVSSNEVYDNLIAGIDLGLTIDCVVTENDVHDNNTPGAVDGAGIVVYRGTGHGVNFNDIYNNGNKGLLVVPVSPPIVDASLNYWGDISGPNCEVAFDGYPINPGGIGDNVTDNVDYLPWLTRDFETVLADEIAYFGFPMVSLETGWNTFSTPIALDPGCDKWDEYVALGDGLAIHSTSPAYAFVGAIQDWLPLIGEDADYPIKPCDAIYVRMAEPDIAAILYSPDVSVPSKDLHAGWNLIGLGWLPEGPVSGMSVPEALDTVYTVTGDLTGYNLVVSPPVNGEQWFFTRDSELEEGPPIEEWLKGYMQEVLEEWSQSGSGMSFLYWLSTEYAPPTSFFLSEQYLYDWLMYDCAFWGLAHGVDMDSFMNMCDGLVDDACYGVVGYLDEYWDHDEWSLHVCLSQYIMEGRMQITQGYWVFMKNPSTLAGFSMTPIPLPMP